jgi:hypothetical protein
MMRWITNLFTVVFRIKLVFFLLSSLKSLKLRREVKGFGKLL